MPPSPRSSPRSREVRAAAAAAATACVAGCYTPGPGMLSSSDSACTYYSTESQPTTVTLVDTRTEEPIFAVEIPPGRQLTVDFLEGKGNDPVNTPDLMRYEVFPLGTKFGKLHNAMTVPNRYSRRLDVSFRAAPEASPAPPEELLRTDQERPAWWTPEGGPLPERKPATMDRP